MTGPAFDDFYEAHFDPVARALVVAGADRDLARDAAQEAFARALARWSRVRDMDRPDGWVYVVAMNHMRDHWKRTRRLDAIEPDPVADRSAAIATRLSVREAIAVLPARQREAVVLRYLADLPLADVAAAMDCAIGTVKATLHQALRAMRVEFQEDDDADR